MRKIDDVSIGGAGKEKRMNKCPKCGRYMSSHMEYAFGSARCLWSCICGYSTRECTTGMQMDTKTRNKNTKITTSSTSFTE